jgi:hypothetical protein
MDKQLLFRTFRNTALAAIYIYIVSQIMIYGEDLFGSANKDFAPFVVLLLFSLSAAVVGGLVFGEAAYLFFDNRKIAAIKAAIYSVAWLGLYTVVSLIILAIIK